MDEGTNVVMDAGLCPEVYGGKTIVHKRPAKPLS